MQKGTTAQKETAIKNYELSNASHMTALAKTLKEHVVKQKLYVLIKGKNYVMSEGWGFAGGLLGLYPRITSVENLSTENEIKWKAVADIVEIKTGKVVSSGFAVCSNKEATKRAFEEYAVLSMAQTRVISRAFRNIVGWIMKISGYESTPAEEVPAVEEKGIDREDAFNKLFYKLNSLLPEKRQELARKTLNTPPFPLSIEQIKKLESICTNQENQSAGANTMSSKTSQKNTIQATSLGLNPPRQEK